MSSLTVGVSPAARAEHEPRLATVCLSAKLVQLGGCFEMTLARILGRDGVLVAVEFYVEAAPCGLAVRDQ